MDNLSLRRALYQDPSRVSAQQLNDDPQLAQLQQELLQQDQRCKQLLSVDVPAQLADRILLQQRLQPVRWYRRPWPYASAAALLLSLWFWQAQPPALSADLGQQALGHVYHELAALGATTALNADSVQPLFAEIGVTAALPMPVVYARFCHFEGVRALHLVLEIDGQPLTLFVLPAQPGLPDTSASQFADARFFGKSVTTARHHLVMVAEQPQLLAQIGPVLLKSLKFNI